MPEPLHIGRFAPSPTGPLHLGSLVAALGSWLCARKHQGQWLVRMEDLDPPREQAGAAESILRALEAHGLEWDGEVMYQSSRHGAYADAIEQLRQSGMAYFCSCSRKQLLSEARLGKMGPIYPGTCRDRSLTSGAVRCRVNDEPTAFVDMRLGHYQQRLESELGDFVIQRRDKLYAYQIAVVVDDEHQGITDIVRGEDLLDNTPRQCHLQNLLGYKTPRYLHLPLVRNEQGQKLSKQNCAPALDNADSSTNLMSALGFLGFDCPDTLRRAPADQLLQWALNETQWETTALSAYAS